MINILAQRKCQFCGEIFDVELSNPKKKEACACSDCLNYNRQMQENRSKTAAVFDERKPEDIEL